MRTARAIVGLALMIIGSIAIADQSDGDAVWWLLALLAAAGGVAGLITALRPGSSGGS